MYWWGKWDREKSSGLPQAIKARSPEPAVFPRAVLALSAPSVKKKKKKKACIFPAQLADSHTTFLWVTSGCPMCNITFLLFFSGIHPVV